MDQKGDVYLCPAGKILNCQLSNPATIAAWLAGVNVFDVPRRRTARPAQVS